MSENENPTEESMTKWVIIHLIGSIIAVFGLLYLLADMNLLPGVITSAFQAGLAVAAGLVLDFWGVIGISRVKRARKAAKASKA